MYAFSIGFAIGCRGKQHRGGPAPVPAARHRWVSALEGLGHQSIRAIATTVANLADLARTDGSQDRRRR